MCKKKLASWCLPFPLFLHFSFSPIKFSVTDFPASLRARVFKFCIHLESGLVYCGTENQDAEIYFFLFPFFLFSISHSNVIHREICVKDFSGFTAPKILKFGTNVGYDMLCKRESACCCLSFRLFVHFSFSPIKLFVTEFSAPITVRVFKFCLHLERGQVYCGKENQDGVINFCLSFSIFPSLTPLQYMGKFVSKISQELLYLGFWNLEQMLGMTFFIV